MYIKHITNPQEVKALIKSLKPAKKDDRQGAAVMAEADLSVFWGAECWALFDNGDRAVSINLTRIGKRKKNAWEPYANWYIAYTPMNLRNKGYASKLALHVRKVAKERGCVRIKSLAGTRMGLGLHKKCGDLLWAVTEKLEVAIDSPLTENYPTDSTPMSVRKYTERTTPLTYEEVDGELRGKLMCYDLK